LPERAIDRLGGSVKQVAVMDCYDLAKGLRSVLDDVCTSEWLAQQFPAGRIEYGVSAYGFSRQETATIQRHFLGLKKELRGDDRAVRFVTSKEPQLSAVTIHRNGLDKRGKEFVLFKSSQNIVLGVTTAVQDYQAYGVRDFGRPAANPKSGMLPPKVCQMMLNIAQVQSSDILLDPFCGSGTMLQEALLLGIHEVHGSDNDVQAVKDTQENIRWLMKEYPKIQANVEITRRDARETYVKPSVIVTEPYLGKPLRGHEPQSFLLQETKQLEKLYTGAAQHWSKDMKPGGRVVMVWPEFAVGEENAAVDVSHEFQQFGFMPRPLLSESAAKLLNQGERWVVTYGRDQARVRRQIRSWIFEG
jgi:tRNA G10  N-methylase Trm11